MHSRANYVTVYVGAQLAPADGQLDLDWATDAGDETDAFEFEVPVADPQEPLVGIQAFDVGEYGHEILVNGESLSGFDVPPNEGWQYWVDTVTGASLREGTNTVKIARDTDSDDAFAVGTLTLQWKESVE
ncbi:hypothetical protein ACFO0N_08750 [Halobium salinum]|uniref:Uncharacterized protein n=1 Tax=Halobium salinum TaxID=1364940 RepID=A0ABD5PBB9_9EURY|nr:hypothetical protein [Halobium salinum]